jgi:hypothetical protein
MITGLLILVYSVLCLGLNRRGNAAEGSAGVDHHARTRQNHAPVEAAYENINFGHAADAVIADDNDQQTNDYVNAVPIQAGMFLAQVPPTSDDIFEQDPRIDHTYRFIRTLRDLANVGWAHNEFRRIDGPMDQSKLLTIVFLCLFTGT